LCSVFKVEELVTNHDYEEALSLAENIDFEELPNKLDILKQIRLRYGYHLFAQGQYARAMEYFYSEKVLNSMSIQMRYKHRKNDSNKHFFFER
jgi:hypothetical protein